MNPLINKYIHILEIELDDLESDLNLLIQTHLQKKENEKITNYVFLENLAVIKNEISGIEQFKQILNEIVPDEYTDLDDFTKDLENRFKACVHRSGFVEAVYSFVEKKMKKVIKYVMYDE